MGDLVNHLFSDLGELGEEGFFIELKFQNEERVALLDYEELAKYPEIAETYSKDRSTGFSFKYGGGEKGDFEFILGKDSEIYVGDHTVKVRRCQDIAWKTAYDTMLLNGGKIRQSNVVDDYERHHCTESETLHF